MPARPKVSTAKIIAATRRLIEEHGRDGFSMKHVAAAVNVRAPSLYGHFADRAALLEEVELHLFYEVGKTLRRHARPGDPLESIKKQARAYRRFAKRNRNGYALLFDVRSKHSERGRRARAEALVPILAALGELIGERKALLAARVLAPYLHGFISMEIAAAFRMGPGLETAFENGLDTILRGLASGGR